ncbi:membrane protein insertion efficiency factor YidD [bacterium]|nr:membrane protein insertion efficiency factor YidD [bacterium]|tara:strand:- start:217 stop:453 length:237 start_codon:yes stop_codon:yes gene_type:complete
MKKIISYIFILPIKIYQMTLSKILPSTCRFKPSCSQYTIQAINNHGPLKGIILGTIRILKCNPLFKSGIDEVPPGDKK